MLLARARVFIVSSAVSSARCADTTPAAVVARLNQEIIRAADKPRLKESFIAQGARAVTSTPAELTRRVEDEIKTWKSVISKANLKVE